MVKLWKSIRNVFNRENKMQNANRQWILVRRPDGEIQEGDLELRESAIPQPGDGEVLVRNIYLSLDPTNRIWMSDIDQYMPPVEIGDVMRGGTLGVVEQSRSDLLAQGDIVLGGMGWEDYFTAPAGALNKLPVEMGIPLPAFMSVVGMTGLTAYFGTLDICQPKSGETFVVSAAAGAVGSIAGQLAKLEGARVVGIAGSDEKCRWLTNDLGFDAAINYKSENVLDALGTRCPDGIDCYFENVGGEILDAVLTHLNKFSRIALCGLIATYNAKDPVPGPYMFRNLLMKSTTLKGFIVIDYMDRFQEGLARLGGLVLEDKLKYQVDINPGLENAPKILNKLFTGENKGKLLVQISKEP